MCVRRSPRPHRAGPCTCVCDSSMPRLAFLLFAAVDFITDAFALLELDDRHLRWGIAAMVVALVVNFTFAVFGFFRVAWKRQLLENKVVRRRVWEHTAITVIAVTGSNQHLQAALQP